MKTKQLLSEFIAEELKKRNWSGLDVGTMLGGIQKSVVSKIINGKQAPSLTQMILMSEMFSVPLDDIVQMRLNEELVNSSNFNHHDNKSLEVIKIFHSIPVSEMLKRNWASLENRNDLDEVISVFGPMLESFKNQNGLAHKTGIDHAEFTPTQSAWLFQVRRIATLLKVSEYSPSKVVTALEQLSHIMVNQSSMHLLFQTLNNAGIRLVLVECKGSKIDGVCTWLDDNSPVIGLSLRFDREDNFWFMLRHELEHVLQGYSAQSKLDDDLFTRKDSIDQCEEEANLAAQEFCAPHELTEKFIAQSNGLFREEKVVQFAKNNNLLPSALAGQIRHKLNRYNILSKLLTPVREKVVQAAPIVDGWGRVPV